MNNPTYTNIFIRLTELSNFPQTSMLNYTNLKKNTISNEENTSQSYPIKHIQLLFS